MRLSKVNLWRIETPFRQKFAHAAATRTAGDAIIVGVETHDGLQGFGEIQARPYVTGEDNDSIWDEHAPAMAERLLGREVTSFASVREVLGDIGHYRDAPACTGGFDIALTDALEVSGQIDWSALFGTRPAPPQGRCLTISGDIDEAGLIKQGRFARLSRCTAVKLKVTGAQDADRVRQLRDTVGSDMDLRLDGNGQLAANAAAALLDAVSDCAVHSVEEPLDPKRPDLVSALRDLHSSTGVALMADESVCTAHDLESFVGTDAYQIINVRVGKAGGVSGMQELIRAALAHGFAIVSGTMVGETAVMLRISEKILHHCAALEYVEGLDQTRTLLEGQAIKALADDPCQHFAWQDEAFDKYCTAAASFG